MTQDVSKGRAPSIRDVARLAGVSHQTVSRVLNAHPSIRDSTKQRVLQVIGELQYRPNRAARSLVTSRSNTIGVLAAGSGAYYGPNSSVHAIEDAARGSGYYVTVSNLAGSDDGAIGDGIEHLMAQAVEGIVVLAPQLPVIDALTELSIGIPFVTMQPGGGPTDHSLGVDQLAGSRLATRHLLELGHRRIRHIAGPQDWIESEARARGFADELAAAGAELCAPVAGDWTSESGYLAARQLLGTAGATADAMADFTAVFSANDQMALGLIHAVREAGLDVPGDISIVGFDDIPEAAHFTPPLTTVRQDFAELGRRCVRDLLARIAGRPALVEAVVAPELIVRTSTARPVVG